MSDKHAFEISFFESIHKREPKFAEVIELLGGLYTNAGRIDDGLKMDMKLVRLWPDKPVAHYNLACSLALKRKSPEALKALEKAMELGYRDIKWMMEDPDLKSLRDHPAFHRLVKQFSDKR
jgi:tetratricopeptide (TPR) repeat protein